MVVCSAKISFDDGACCIQNAFKDVNMELGYITPALCNKQKQLVMTMNIKLNSESKAKVK